MASLYARIHPPARNYFPCLFNSILLYITSTLHQTTQRWRVTVVISAAVTATAAVAVYPHPKSYLQLNIFTQSIKAYNEINVLLKLNSISIDMTMAISVLGNCGGGV